MAVKKTLIFLAVVFLIAFYIGSRGVLNRAAAASIPQPAPSATPLPNRASDDAIRAAFQTAADQNQNQVLGLKSFNTEI